MRVALGVEYDGAPYCGWQSQSNRRGVQDALEASIHAVSGHAIRTHAAGRTDTGVHALAQTVHFDTEVSRPTSAWVRGVNAFLPVFVCSGQNWWMMNFMRDFLRSSVGINIC
jgi:tRNA pseudouridine38-40 synthase